MPGLSEQVPDLKALHALISQKHAIPTLPQVVVRVRRTLDDQKAGAKELGEVILSDSTLTARLLRMANSVYFRRTKARVTTVTHSIVILGFEAVRNLTVGLTVYKLLTKRGAGGMMRRFWRDSLCAALICQFMAEKRGDRLPEEAFIAGLIHDLGRVLMLVYAEPACREAERAIAGGASRIATEQEVFGYDHCEAGELLARHWNYPEAMASAIRFHHPEHRDQERPAASPYLHMLIAADAVKDSLYGYPCQREAWTPDRLHEMLGATVQVTEGEFSVFRRGLRERIAKVAEIMEIPIDAEDLEAPPEEPGEGATRKPMDADRRREEQMRFFGQMTGLQTSMADRDAILRFVLGALARMFGADATAYATWSAADGKFRIPYTDKGPVPAVASRDIAAPEVSKALNDLEVRLLKPAMSLVRPSVQPHTLVVPVTMGGGARGAVLLEWNEKPARLSRDDDSFLRLTGGQLALALERIELFKA